MWKKFFAGLGLLLCMAYAAAFDWQVPNMESRLWKISKAGQPDSYLVGTLHVGRETSRLPPSLDQILRRSEVLYTEVLMPEGAQDLPAFKQDAARLQRLMVVSRGEPSLSEKLGGHRVQALAARAGAGAGGKMFDQLQPWAAAWLDMGLFPPEFKDSQGVDNLLARSAKKYGVKQDALEHHVDVANVFRQLPVEQIKMLLDFNEQHGDLNDALVRKMHELYDSGQYSQLMVLLADEESYTKGMPKEAVKFWRNWAEQDLLTARNRLWLPKLLAELPKRKVLVAVGLAHLPDEQGLIMQLRANGYTVEPVAE